MTAPSAPTCWSTSWGSSCKTGGVPPGEPQPAQGTVYYRIHPVLKHVAILSLENRKRGGAREQRRA